MKEIWNKINGFFGEWWWVILAALALTIIIFVIVVKAKNSRIRKLKRQLKLTRTELEKSKAVPITVTKEQAKTVAQNSAPEASEKTEESFDGSLETVNVETVDIETEEQERQEEPEQFDDNVDYYTRSAVIAPSSGNIKFTVVYDRPKDSWVIKKDGVERVVRRLDTKEEAMQVARALCKKYNANLVVHKKDGRFQKH